MPGSSARDRRCWSGPCSGSPAAARWPNLWLIPTFTDETIEVKLAYDIARGQAAPLTNVDPYIGALWNWVLAVGFWTFGLNPWLPRLLAFLGGVATVGAAWWLGREIGGGGGSAGVVAALFMAGCSTHVLVNSHVAWSHATTPLWTTLGFACLLRALKPLPPTPSAVRGGVGLLRRVAEGGAPRWLVGAGFFLGLGVQTHITAVLLLPGRRAGAPAPAAGPAPDPLGALRRARVRARHGNLLVYNVQTGGGTLRGGQAVLSDYTGQDEGGVDAGNYGENVGRLTLATSWVLSGAIEKRRFVGETLAHPLLLGYLALAVGSVPLGGPAAVAGCRCWSSVPYLLALPLLQGKYEPILNGRYVMPILPLVFASIGLVVADGLAAVRARWPARAPLLGGAAARPDGAGRPLPAGAARRLPALGPHQPRDPGGARGRPGRPRAARRGRAGRLRPGRRLLHGGRQRLQERRSCCSAGAACRTP